MAYPCGHASPTCFKCGCLLAMSVSHIYNESVPFFAVALLPTPERRGEVIRRECEREKREREREATERERERGVQSSMWDCCAGCPRESKDFWKRIAPTHHRQMELASEQICGTNQKLGSFQVPIIKQYLVRRNLAANSYRYVYGSYVLAYFIVGACNCFASRLSSIFWQGLSQLYATRFGNI